MFRATMCPSSGENTVPMRHLVLVTLYDCLVYILHSHLYRVTNTRCRIGTVFSPDDGHLVARNIQRKAINILRKCVHQVGSIQKIKNWYLLPLLGMVGVKRLHRKTPVSLCYIELHLKKVGRPKLRWEDSVVKDMRILEVKNWKKVALNRDEWAKLLNKARTHQKLSNKWWWWWWRKKYVHQFGSI